MSGAVSKASGTGAGGTEFRRMAPNPSVEATPSGKLRLPAGAPHVER